MTCWPIRQFNRVRAAFERYVALKFYGETFRLMHVAPAAAAIVLLLWNTCFWYEALTLTTNVNRIQTYDSDSAHFTFCVLFLSQYCALLHLIIRHLLLYHTTQSTVKHPAGRILQRLQTWLVVPQIQGVDGPFASWSPPFAAVVWKSRRDSSTAAFAYRMWDVVNEHHGNTLILCWIKLFGSCIHTTHTKYIKE